MIKFNIPPRTGEESKYIEDAIESEKICGDGKYTKLCQEILEKKFNSKKIFFCGINHIQLVVYLYLSKSQFFF